MPKTHFPRIGGQQWSESTYRPPFTTGNVFFVSSVSGSSSGPGYSPESAFATIDQAINACTASNGDTIYVMPGHSESVSAAAGIDADVIGISIVGLGSGDARPIVTFDTATTADMDIDAAGITVENIRFRVNFADVVAPIDVNSHGFTLRNCTFEPVATDMNALIWVLGAATTGSHRIVVENCRFYGVDASDTHAISLPGTSDACVIRDCYFHGFYETGAIGAAGAVTKITIVRNLIQNLDTDADACILLAASSTGVVAYNGVGAALAGNATTNISCGSGVVLIENYSVDTGDVQGVLDPIAT